MKNDKKPYYSFQDTKLICRYFVLTTSLQMPPSEDFRPWRPIQGQNCVFRRNQVNISCIAALYTVLLVRWNHTFTCNFVRESIFFLIFCSYRAIGNSFPLSAKKNYLVVSFPGPKTLFGTKRNAPNVRALRK